jgi:hypothetical protein
MTKATIGAVSDFIADEHFALNFMGILAVDSWEARGFATKIAIIFEIAD